MAVTVLGTDPKERKPVCQRLAHMLTSVAFKIVKKWEQHNASQLINGEGCWNSHIIGNSSTIPIFRYRNICSVGFQQLPDIFSTLIQITVVYTVHSNDVPLTPTFCSHYHAASRIGFAGD